MRVCIECDSDMSDDISRTDVCRKCKKKKYNKKYKETNKDKVDEMNSRYRENNKDKISIAKQKYRDENKDKLKENNKEYKKNNRSRINAYNKEYRKNNPDMLNNWIRNNKEKVRGYKKKYDDKQRCDEVYIMTRKIRNSIRSAMRSGGFKKKSKSADILGCTMEEFIIYIKSTFLDGMSIENHGLWHLDHKMPISSAKTYEEAVILNHYSNFQALWAIDNLKKSNNII